MTSELTSYEKHYLLTNPDALLILMDMHDMQQDMADSIEAGCHGDILRYEELRQLGAKIIEADPGIWSDGILRRFAEPTGERARRLANAIAAQPALSSAPALAQPLSLKELCKALIEFSIVDESAVRDSEGYDEGVTLGRIEKLHKRLALTTEPVSVLRELVAVKRLHDAIEAAEARGTENFIGDKPLPFAQDEYEQRKAKAWSAAFTLADANP